MKILKMSLLIVSLFLLTGCGETKMLNCTSNDEALGIEEDYSMEFDDKNELITADFTSLIENKMDYAEGDLNLFCTDYEDLEGVSCDVSFESEDIRLTVNVDMSKASEDVIKNMNFEESNYDSMKSSLEELEFTCE